MLIVGASLHSRGRQVPGVREGLIGQAPPIIDVCRVCVHQYPSHIELGSVHSLQEGGEEAIFEEGVRRGHALVCLLTPLLWKPIQIYAPAGRRMLAQVIYCSAA